MTVADGGRSLVVADQCWATGSRWPRSASAVPLVSGVKKAAAAATSAMPKVTEADHQRHVRRSRGSDGREQGREQGRDRQADVLRHREPGDPHPHRELLLEEGREGGVPHLEQQALHQDDHENDQEQVLLLDRVQVEAGQQAAAESRRRSSTSGARSGRRARRTAGWSSPQRCWQPASPRACRWW